MPFTPVHEPRRLTQDAYLTRVRRDPHTRLAYMDGIVTPVPQDSAAHTRICANFLQIVQAGLKGTVPNCQVFSQPLLAAAPHRPLSTAGMFAYADLAMTLAGPDYRDVSHALWNPTIIVEVCSPETEAFDAGEKFLRYRHGLPSLQEYVLVAQDRCEIGHYRALGTDQWPLTVTTDLDDVLILNRIPCRVALADVYEGVLVHQAREGELETSEEPAWQWYER